MGAVVVEVGEEEAVMARVQVKEAPTLNPEQSSRLQVSTSVESRNPPLRMVQVEDLLQSSLQECPLQEGSKAVGHAARYLEHGEFQVVLRQ